MEVHQTMQHQNGESMVNSGAVSTVQHSSPQNGTSKIMRNSKQLANEADELQQQQHNEELLRRRSASILEVQEQAHGRLNDELKKAQQELKLKDEQCKNLTHIQDQMNTELVELTAKLFEEANKMVQDANVKRMQSEKLLSESNAKIEVLQAEVTALKTLVITSTPSMPNRHLHPQISSSTMKQPDFVKGHRRSTSHHNFSKEITAWDPDDAPPLRRTDSAPVEENREVDSESFEEFRKWRLCPTLEQDCSFLKKIIGVDVGPCMAFQNAQLATGVFESLMENTLTIEPVAEKTPFPRLCALTAASRICKFRIKLGDAKPTHFISQFARNRVAAVCDFISYVRYITQGLVKSQESDMYWEIVRLRKKMCITRLGFGN